MKKVLKFEDLSEKNKTQFLQLLLKNQIPTKPQNIHHSPLKNKFKNNLILTVIDPNILKTPIPHKKKSQIPTIQSYSKSPNTKKQEQSILKKIPINKKLITATKNNNNYPEKQLSDRSHIKKSTPPKVNFDMRQNKIKQPSKTKTIEKATEEDRVISTTFSMFLKCFNFSMVGNRPIKLTLNQLLKTIQQINDQLYSKMTHLNRKNNNYHQFNSFSAQKEPKKHMTPFHEIVFSFYAKRFKNTRLAVFNLINVLYSLSYFSNHNLHPVSRKCLQIFTKFLVNEYDVQLIIFFLCTRNMLQKIFKVHFLNLWQKNEEVIHSRNNYILDENKLITFLEVILQNQNDLITKYKNIIFQNKKQKQVHFYEILDHLMQDFIDKRLSDEFILENDTEELFSKNLVQASKIKINKQQELFKITQTIKNTTIQQDNFIDPFNDKFWICKEINEIQIEEELEDIILLKLSSKLQNLIEMVTSQQQNQQKEKIFMVTLKKAINLMHLAYTMDTTGWFQQLQIKKPQSKDLQKIENLHSEIIKVKKLYNEKKQVDKNISNLCKNLLTVQPFTLQLQKIII